MTTPTATKVIFKRFPEWDVIALFPTFPGDCNPYRTCMSYMHTRKHAAATMDLFTLPAAQPAEYAPLMTELESLGYTLRIAHRATRRDMIARKNAL